MQITIEVGRGYLYKDQVTRAKPFHHQADKNGTGPLHGGGYAGEQAATGWGVKVYTARPGAQEGHIQ